ncbi:MAG TPA: glycogen debranching N-terminal domain-containing protein [Mycobacteriales bacterium]|nr:glycogen debranching N-terminal domain-containing protein [Mycobacteriales bacterium]
MTEGWAFGGAPPVTQPGGIITLVEGVTFSLSGRTGDIRPGAEQGLFFRDTRFLSRFELTLDGQALEPLSATLTSPFSAAFVGRRPPRPGTADSTLLVIRKRYVGGGLREDITVRNLGREAAAFRLTLTVDTDFAGLFEVKEGRARAREGLVRTASDDELRLSCRWGDEGRAVSVWSDSDATVTEQRLEWPLVLPSRSDRTLTVQVSPSVDELEEAPRYTRGQPVELARATDRLQTWRQVAPRVTTPDESLRTLLATSAEDLGVLRIFDAEHPDRVAVAAGAPWFMTLFGRDSLLTSWMLLPLDPSIATGTLHTLASMQGSKVDPLSEEQPGRILHEVRAGLDAQETLGGRVYYGTADATPLFVMLLGELARWGLAEDDVATLLPHADRALAWVRDYGDSDGDGFVEYHRATDRGLLHQGWKDSFDAISYAGGRLAEPPIALAEVQGYVYGAYLARAHFARNAGDQDQVAHWSELAATLKCRFNEQFWLPDRGYYALALDADKRPVDALASNQGHCLWTGIADEDKAVQVAKHLTSPEMMTGFGVRTLASSMGGYNPVSYHNGSVWPHDSAIVAAGLMRYGFVAEAQQVALALLDAAKAFGGRLPELFCGFDRTEFPEPVPYPTACSPQAWAAAAPLYVLRTLLRFDPWVPANKVWCSPVLPERLLPLRIDNLRLAGAEVGLEVDSDGWRLTGLPAGIELVQEPRQPLTAVTAETTS